MSKESAISAIERRDLSELCHVLDESEWDHRSEPLDSEGQSALHIACTSGHLDIVEYLVIEKQCSVTVEDVYGHTPLLLSLINKHWKIADFLLQNTILNEQIHGVQKYHKLIITKVAKEVLHESYINRECKNSYSELLMFISIIKSNVEEQIEKARSSGDLHYVHHMNCTIPDDMPDIHVACIVGDMEKLKSALDSNGQSILGTTDCYGIAAIHYAAYEPNVMSMIIEISKGGEVLNLSDKRGNTVLHHCVISGCIESVECVIGVPECNVNQQNDEGDAPLHVACKRNNTAAVQLLVVNERCDLNIYDKKGDTALHIIAHIESNGQEIVKCLLRSSKCDLNQVNSEYETPLHVACKYGHYRVVEMLVGNGADVEAVDKDGNTAYHIAGHNLHFNCLRLLEKHLNQLNADGDTVLHTMCGMDIPKNKLSEFVELLRETKELDINKFNVEGEAPLHIACRWSSGDVVGTLVAMECDVNAYNGLGNTALHIAVSSGIDRLQKVKCLLESAGCNVNQLNDEGDTPLHIACNTAAVRLFGRCDLNIDDKKGDTALHDNIAVCIESNGIEMVKCLLRSDKCDLNQVNNKHETPLHVACKHRQVGVVEILVADERCDPFIQDINGDTALYAAVCTDVYRDKMVQVLLHGCRYDFTNKDCTRCMNELNLFIDFVFSGVKSMLNMSDYHVILKGRKSIALILRKGASMNNFKMLLLHIANCRSLCSGTLHFEVPNPLIEHEHSSYYTTVTLLVQMKTSTCARSEQKKTLFMKYVGTCGSLSYNSDQETLLHAACRSGYSAMTATLLKNGADTQAVDKNGNTAIHTACHNLQYKCLEILGKSLNQLNADGDAVLHILCGMEISKEKLPEFVEFLRETKELDINMFNKKGETPLHIACRWSNGHVVGALVAMECDVNSCDGLGNTALHITISSERDRLQKVQCLLESGKCNPNVCNKRGHTPIHVACRGENIEVLDMLVTDQRCDVNIRDDNGNTPLHTAILTHSVVQCRKLQLLLQIGTCDCNLINKDGSTSLHIASMKSNVSLVELLIAYKRCDINIQDNNGDTALHKGVKSAEVVKCLIEKCHARCDISNQMGETPFHRAIVKGVLGSVKLFLKAGEVVQQSDINGNAPIHTSCQYSRLEILKAVLGSKSCDPNQQNANGDTALHIVSRMTLSLEAKLQYLQLLLSTPRINPEVVNNEHLAPFDATDNDGNTILHNACAEAKPLMSQLLIENGADVLKPDRHGNAPIHISCQYSRLENLNAVLGSKSCDPNQQNANGDTALHIVSRMTLSLETKLQYLQLLLSTPGINPEVLNNKHRAPFDISDKDGNTLLHNACAEGKSEMVQLLIENGADIQRQDRHGNAPIHIACLKLKLDIVRILLSCKLCNPNQQNEDGDTALHIVCRMRIGNVLEYLKLLFSIPGINPDIANYAGLTLIEVAGANYAIIDALEKFLNHKKSSIQAYLKLFVVGNSGAGKSTLIKAVTTQASQLLKYSPFQRMKYVDPRDVPPRTAGIVPIPFNSKHFGNAVLYDFAGQHEYYSSHAAVMENLILPSPPLFLLLVDISKPMEEIKEELLYWWHFIDNQSQKATAPPHVLLGGSHKDIVKQRGRHEVHTIRMEMEDCINDIKVSFKFAGFFPMDCRRLVSQGLTKLLTQLQTTCKVLREAVDINLHCHILNAFLTTSIFGDKVYCRISDIVDQIEAADLYLPQHSLELIPLLKALNDQGHILLLENHTDEDKSWVILKPEVLLTDVNGSVFAPDNFQKRSIHFSMSTGVVTFSKLKDRFTNYNNEVIVAYLIHHEFCFRIKDQHTLDMITNNQVPRTHSTEDQEKYYFFPALVSVENPEHICQYNENITFECGWFYVCGQRAEQLTTRFLHVLILRLAFACEPTDNPTEAESVVLLRSCSVWKHGIAWLNNYGIETIVEVGLQCRWVAVMIRCPDNEKVHCAELRTKVIKTVVKTRDDFCPAITMKEFLIHPSNLQYPFEGRKLTLYSIREIAKVIVEGKPLVMDTMGKNLICIPKLLPFEPYFGIDYLIEIFFVGDTSLTVTPDNMTRLEIKYENVLKELKQAFKHDIRAFQMECAGAECTEVESCNRLFHILERRGFKKWTHFEEVFSRFSIFCGKNPMVRTARHVQLSTFIIIIMYM